ELLDDLELVGHALGPAAEERPAVRARDAHRVRRVAQLERGAAARAVERLRLRGRLAILPGLEAFDAELLELEPAAHVEAVEARIVAVVERSERAVGTGDVRVAEEGARRRREREVSLGGDVRRLAHLRDRVAAVRAELERLPGAQRGPFGH